MFEKIAEKLGVSETEHPTLAEAGGCIEAWICYQMREELADGREVCGGCGRVLIEDTSAWKHDPENMPSREDSE
jgi:hypothetical protein